MGDPVSKEVCIVPEDGSLGCPHMHNTCAHMCTNTNIYASLKKWRSFDNCNKL